MLGGATNTIFRVRGEVRRAEVKGVRGRQDARLEGEANPLAIRHRRPICRPFGHSAVVFHVFMFY